ncbi:MAG: TIM barrel protein [Bryobacterales bacterium]|nr:TIM barrel protein [Bryobacterales bacterium]
MFCHRRRFLAAALGSSLLHASAFDRSRLAIIADEAGDTLEEWISFARRYHLSHLEMRAIIQAGHPVMLDDLPPAELKSIAARLASEGIKVSFFNSALLKYTLPGTVAVEKEDWYESLYARQRLTPEILYRTRKERLQRALEAAHILGTSQLRTFTFWRVQQPRLLYPRLVDLIGEMGEAAKSANMKLLVETEFATNVATSAEMRDLLVLLPSSSIGINWDPQNSLVLEPDVFPAGYRKLPKDRIWNVQIKAEGLFGRNGKNKLPWGEIFQTMHNDGYRGLFGLETHFGHGPANFAMSLRAMDEIIRLAGAR